MGVGHYHLVVLMVKVAKRGKLYNVESTNLISVMQLQQATSLFNSQTQTCLHLKVKRNKG